MTIRELMDTKEKVEDYIEQLNMCITIAPDNGHSVKISLMDVIEIRDLLDSYLGVINGVTEKVEIEWAQ